MCKYLVNKNDLYRYNRLSACRFRWGKFKNFIVIREAYLVKVVIIL